MKNYQAVSPLYVYENNTTTNVPTDRPGGLQGRDGLYQITVSTFGTQKIQTGQEPGNSTIQTKPQIQLS